MYIKITNLKVNYYISRMKFKNPIPISDIAAWIDATIIGDSTGTASGINEIHHVEVGDITFVDHEKYYDFTLKSAASFIIINKKIDAIPDKTILFCEQPFDAYTLICEKTHPIQHSLAPIASNAKIGKNTIIYPNVYIGHNVTIGDNCIIHPFVAIYDNTIIGNDVIIHANSTIGKDAFYYKNKGTHFTKMPTIGNVVIADQVEIGAGNTIDAGVSIATTIGRGTKTDGQVHIGHDVVVGENCIICAQVGIAGNSKIGNFVTLYGKAGVSKNITLADGTQIMGASSIGKSTEKGKAYLGTPAEELRTVARQLAIIKKLPELWDKFVKS